MLKTVQQLQAEAQNEIPEVTPQQVKADIAGPLPYLLVDVREPQEQQQGVIPNAVCIPRGVLELQITKHTQDEKKPIVCYCGGGTRSLFAAQQLKRMGYENVRSMAGGFRDWMKGSGPVSPP